jgi:hypothetical protein
MSYPHKRTVIHLHLGNLFKAVLSGMMPLKQWPVRLQLLAGTLAWLIKPYKIDDLRDILNKIWGD